MIITRSPLRISLGGGGTDLPSYYQAHEGFLLSAAIDKYVYITLHKTFTEELILKYSQMEKVKETKEVEHPIIRSCLQLMNLDAPHLEITSMADIPAGTGLGSSSSFTCALLRAIHAHKRSSIFPDALAEQACHVELEMLGEPIGKQDQYISAIGGITSFMFNKDGQVLHWPVQVSESTIHDLEDNLLLFFTGYSRSASGLLKDQDERSKQNDPKMIEELHFTKELGHRSAKALEEGNLHEFAKLMHMHWERKKVRSTGISNWRINQFYETGMKNGALGGKLIGAGGGGFLMFYTEDRPRLVTAMREAGLKEVRFRFDFEGTKILKNGG